MLHIFTCLTDVSRIKYLKQSANQHNVKIKYIIANEWSGYCDKIDAMKTAIQTLNDTDIVGFIDAYDVLINADSETILKRFLEFNTQIVFGSEIACYPSKHFDKHNEYNKEIDKSEKQNTEHKYLNAGGYMGYVKSIREMLHWKSEETIYNICLDGTDQSYFMEYLFSNTNQNHICLNTEANFVLNLHNVNWNDLEFRDGYLYNNILKNRPCFIHFNGGTWQTNEKESILPVFIEKKRQSILSTYPLNLTEYSQIVNMNCYPKLQKITNPINPIEYSLKNKDPFIKYIDHVFYINLNRRPDRREQMETQLKTYNIKAERFEAVDRPEPGKGIVGCTQSHMEVLKLAKDRNYQTILILEDDFEFQVSPEELREQINHIFINNVKFDVCMLGYKLDKEETTEYSFLKKAIEAQSASAYLVTFPFYQKIIDLYKWAIPLLDTTKEHWKYANDQVWKKIQPTSNWYCLYPRVGKQRDGYSDNSESFTVYDC